MHGYLKLQKDENLSPYQKFHFKITNVANQPK